MILLLFLSEKNIILQPLKFEKWTTRPVKKKSIK